MRVQICTIPIHDRKICYVSRQPNVRMYIGIIGIKFKLVEFVISKFVLVEFSLCTTQLVQFFPGLKNRTKGGLPVFTNTLKSQVLTRLV